MAHKVDRHTLQVTDTNPNPKHTIFKYNEVFFGGTETMARGFLKNILPEMRNIHKYTNVIIPGHFPSIQTMGLTGEKYIFWIHNNISQFISTVKDILTNRAVREHTAYIVAVSEYEAKVIANEINFPLDKIIVIQNAIEMITPNLNKFDNIEKVKIIHASTAERGMGVLLDAIPFIEEDFELNIFNDFYPDISSLYNRKSIDDPRVNFYGKTPRKTVYKFFADSHIHAYPSTYPETSCLTQMEALSAGCYTVHTNLGALPETSMGHGVMIPFDELTPQRYAEELTKAIRQIKEHGYDYTKQVQDIQDNFTWQKAKERWLAFDAII
jgi:glycosyltransferase involved in cell wall biosynthesis